MKKIIWLVLLVVFTSGRINAQCVNNIYAGFGGYDFDKGQVIIADSAQNVYICGFFTDSIQLGSFNLLTDSSGQFLCKVSPSGSVLWAKTIYDNDGVGFYPPVLKLDHTGQLLIAGTCQALNANFDTIVNAFSNGDLFIARFDVSTGELKRFVSTGRHLQAYIIDMDIDSSNNVYLAGMFSGVIDFDTISLNSTSQTNSFIAKFDSSDQVIWAQRITTSSATTGNRIDNIDYDQYNHIFVSGWYGINAGFGGGVTLNSPVYTNGFIAKYNLDGNIKWARSSDTNTVYNFQAIQDTANIVVMQASPDKMVWYNQKGDTTATRLVSSSATGSIFSKLVLANQKYYSTGNFNNTVTINDSVYTSPGASAFVACLFQDGTTDYVRTISSNGILEIYDLAADYQENIFITGLYGQFDTINQNIPMPGWGNSEVLYIKRCNNPSSVWDDQSKKIGGLYIFPNPSRTLITIYFPERGKIMISNILGEVMYEKWLQPDDQLKAGIDISAFPNGIYVMRIGELTGKFIKN